ncbi:MAG: TonB-dependent receptor [Bacteroidales bacterium]|nr:TonB-dependent receptor [Bacteroidales bacterium]
MRIFLIILVFSLFVDGFSQNITISGFIEDANTGERLPGANVYETKSKNGTSTNAYGFFSLKIQNADSAAILFSYIGYSPQLLEFKPKQNIETVIKLIPGNLIEEVVVTGTREQNSESKTEMSIVSIPIKQIQLLPAIGGESDILKALQLMPGVQSGNEGSSGLYVRGGSPDQNLILLDDVPLYYVNHLGGFVSIFNTDAVSNISLSKGGFPARYGNRLSSILDVRMKEGNMKEFHGSGMFGIVASKISLEGPIKRDTSSFIVSYRRFLYDLITRPLSKKLNDGTEIGYNFYDFNLKINQKINKNNRLFLSLYSGDDKIMTKNNYGDKSNKEYYSNTMQWGNNLAALRWNHVFNRNLFSNITGTYTRYRFLTSFESVDNYINQRFSYNFLSGIYDLGIKADLEYNAGANYKVKFGFSSVYHQFKPGVSSLQQIDQSEKKDTSFGSYNLQAIGNGVYVENIFNIGKNFNANIGGRLSTYAISDNTFFSPEPRVLFNYELKRNISLKASFAQMQQNVHLLTGSGIGMPMDFWVPATNKIHPSKSKQFGLGIKKVLSSKGLEFTLEGYYKDLNNLITYSEASTFIGSQRDWQEKVENNGIGKSFGAELLIQKKYGKTTGWIGYTLSKTTRQFPGINLGKPYLYRYDRPHDISIVVSHKLSDKIDFSATWVYGTGNAISLPTGKYRAINEVPYFDEQQGGVTEYVYGGEIDIYEGINTFRMRDYHRLDVGINFHKKKKWGERTVNLSIYNLYGRQNPYYYYFESGAQYGNNGPIEGTEFRKLKQQSLFPFIPSISYSFKF